MTAINNRIPAPDFAYLSRKGAQFTAEQKQMIKRMRQTDKRLEWEEASQSGHTK